jgi:DNA polymerase
MNDNGVPLDLPLIRSAQAVVDDLLARINARTHAITGGLRPTQRDKIMAWLDNNGAAMANMRAATVHKHLNGNVHLVPQTRELLEMRVEASMASTKKLESMRTTVGKDGRARGMHLHYGAHTGRAAGKLIQPQNFKRGWDNELAMRVALDALRTGDAEFFQFLYDRPMETISNVIRGFIAAKRGHKLLVCDYSQIEARLVDWYADNKKGLEEWASGIDKYKLMATHIFQVELKDVTDEMRRIAKNAVLGCGFGMSEDAFLVYCHNNGATNVDSDLAELAVGTYRSVNEPVVDLWDATDQYAKAAIRNPGEKLYLRKLCFYMREHWLCIRLPSGNRLMYPHARLEIGRTKFGKIREGIVFEGAYGKHHTYGAKLVENYVQATARDQMYHGMRCAYEEGDFEPVLSVHDEGGFEEEDGPDIQKRLDRLKELMCDTPEWLAGCPIAVKGFVTDFYRKD